MQKAIIESLREIQARHEEIDELEEANDEQTQDVWADLLYEFEKAYDAQRPATPAYKKVKAAFALVPEDADTEAIRAYQKMLKTLSNAVNTLKYYRDDKQIRLQGDEVVVSGEWTTYGETDRQSASFPMSWAPMTADELVQMLSESGEKAEEEAVRFLEAFEKSKEDRERALYETLRAKYEPES